MREVLRRLAHNERIGGLLSHRGEDAAVLAFLYRAVECSAEHDHPELLGCLPQCV
jgi:hypothetical protein